MQLVEIDNILDQIDKDQDDLIQILQQTIKIFKCAQDEFDQAMLILENHKNVDQTTANSTNQCNLCEKYCCDEQVLKIHYLNAHKIRILDFGPNLYTCRVCFKQFKGLINLYFHERYVKHKISKGIKRTQVKKRKKE